MLTWHIDRLFRSGPLCAIVTFLVPVGLALAVSSSSDVGNVRGILFIAAGIIFIGSLVGSIVATGLGTALLGFGCVVAEVPVWLLLIVGCCLYATLIVHDLAGTFHRAPAIKRAVWTNAAKAIITVTALSAAAFAVSYTVAKLTTWQAIVVPFGIAAIGFAVKLAADSHVAAARKLTAKRTR